MKGVRKRNDGRGKPYYSVVQINGRRYQTPDCATADEAADAGKMLRKLLSRSETFPPCTCGKAH